MVKGVSYVFNRQVCADYFGGTYIFEFLLLSYEARARIHFYRKYNNRFLDKNAIDDSS